MFLSINVFVLFARCGILWTDIRIAYRCQYAILQGLELRIESDANDQMLEYPLVQQIENPPFEM